MVPNGLFVLPHCWCFLLIWTIHDRSYEERNGCFFLSAYVVTALLLLNKVTSQWVVVFGLPNPLGTWLYIQNVQFPFRMSRWTTHTRLWTLYIIGLLKPRDFTVLKNKTSSTFRIFTCSSPTGFLWAKIQKAWGAKIRIIDTVNHIPISLFKVGQTQQFREDLPLCLFGE